MQTINAMSSMVASQDHMSQYAGMAMAIPDFCELVHLQEAHKTTKCEDLKFRHYYLPPYCLTLFISLLIRSRSSS